MMPKQSLRQKIFNVQNKEFKVIKDEILIPQTSLGQKVSSKTSYLVYKSGYPSFMILLKQLAVACTSALLFYYTFKKKRSYITYTFLLAINIGILSFLLRSPKVQIWKNIKLIELGYDMNKVNMTLVNNKKLYIELKDLYLVNQDLQKASKSNLLFDDVVIGVKGKSYSIPLQNAIIPDEDLFVSVIRGYKLVNDNK